ncbi:MAG: tetratricopeptide repeat protein [Fibromonadaceae bacterium]|jgi:tetratricopeptide (TPR) repeat protein|nr:tetratricopeptide repeat protein [Fibromonadaceae bacterium]
MPSVPHTKNETCSLPTKFFESKEHFFARSALAAFALACFFGLQGCTCCAYFNHAWNMEVAYEDASVLRQQRQDSIPGDSLFPVGKERGLYDRVIEKGSRTVERFPKNETQVPKAVFMMAEAFRYKGEWKRAVEKYDELERYFPKYDSMPKAEYQRAFCLYKNAEYALSRFSAENILESGETHKFYLPALELMSLLQEKDGLTENAINSLEKVLASNFGTPWTRARARIRLADLYYEQANYEKAREHYTHKELLILPFSERYRAYSTAAECLLEKDKLAAAGEYKALADSAVFESSKNLSLTRQGEILLSISNNKGVGILRDVAYSEPKSEIASRAFFGIGDYRQTGKDYPAAILLYDSSFQSLPSSKWGKESYSRKTALSKLLALKDTVKALQTAEKPFFPQEFQIAELFLLKLSETDSAIALLAKMDSTLTDLSLKVRAAYTRGFIYDEFKKDTSKAYPIYRSIIENYPQTDYAKQAQSNMGLQVSLKTIEDLARDAFLEAEQSWLVAQKIPDENFEGIDLAYQNAIALYDSVISKYPQTQTYIQAMFAKACILADELGDTKTAQEIFGKIGREHYKTPWGKAATAKIAGKMQTTSVDVERLRKRVEQSEISIKQQSDNYWQEVKNKKNEPPPPPKVADDEILRNDYNTLYDFK